MKLRQLEYFVAVVEARSFTRAAERLGLAQPALGQQVRKLEEELEVPLLRRHSRGVAPTEAGTLLLEHARRILSDVAETAMRVREFGGGAHGRVTLGLTRMMSAVLAGPLLRRVSREAPQLQLDLVEEMSSVLMEWVAGDRVQIALAFNVAGGPGLRWEPVLEESLCFVESSGCGKANGGTIGFAEVARHRLVVPSSPHSIRSLVEAASRACDVPLDVLCHIHSVGTVRDLVAQQVAATVMPYRAVRGEVEAGVLIAKRIVDPQVKRELYFVHSDRRSLSKAERYLRGVLLEMVAREVDATGDWTTLAGRVAAV